MICQKCHRMLVKKMQWFSRQSETVLLFNVCPEHGFVRGKIRIKKAEDGRLSYGVKTMKLVDENAACML